MKKIEIILGIVFTFILSSCEADDIYIDCGYVSGWNLSTVTIESDCGGHKTYYDWTTPVTYGQYICYD